jgi:[acyl-carrier-protein] S-malonyltransferase
MRTALLFAGQATQYVGMGRLLHDRFPEARQVFEAADAALDEPLTRLCFEGPEADLNRTENTQPAVLTVACAAWRVLEARGFQPTVLAGHSLGEYGALVAAGALTFEDAVRLCRRRGTYMQQAVPEGVGAMAAVQRADDAAIQAACDAAPGVCEPAVFNAPKLVVLSGEAAAVESACAQLAEGGAMIIPLKVSAPFHCQLLAPAAERLAADLEGVEIGPLRHPYVANVDAEWVTASTPGEVRDRLVRQVTGAVRWRESIAAMLAAGVERFWHLGPGRANLTHVKRQARRAPMGTLDGEKDLNAILAELEAS